MKVDTPGISLLWQNFHTQYETDNKAEIMGANNTIITERLFSDSLLEQLLKILKYCE